MSGRKNMLITLGAVISAGLIVAAVSAMLVSYYDSRLWFHRLNDILWEIVRQEPETEKVIASALKEYMGGAPDGAEADEILSALGYRSPDFSVSNDGKGALWAAAGAAAGVFLFLITFVRRNKAEALRIQALADYLREAHAGRARLLKAPGEDDFSKLEDEIYKTVTFLYRTKEAAVQAKNDFAQNLSNIAHQIKTPITAISLSVQMMRQDFDGQNFSDAACLPVKYTEQMEKQLLRLTHLEEALLVLSRIDAGTLPLRKEETDIYTILVLAADNLQELSAGSGTSIEVEECGEMSVIADLDWTMEAFMNVMKNCMEHNRGGTVHCSCIQNSLYTEILIQDDGEGLAKEDIPHLFERFYRGKNAGENGIGIGLALSKEIIERQNGTIRAENKPEGGALFEIRFYCH